MDFALALKVDGPALPLGCDVTTKVTKARMLLQEGQSGKTQVGR